MTLPPFAAVPRSVLYQAGLSGYAKLIYALLVAHWNADEQRARPGYSTLATLSGWSRPTVIKAVEELGTAGLIVREHGRYANHYRIPALESPSTSLTLTNGHSQPGLPTESTSFTSRVNHVDTELDLLNKTYEQDPEAFVPGALQQFDARLRSMAGYRPTKSFYAKVAAKYAALDLEEEAEKMVGWLGTKRQKPCSTAFVLNWLGKALKDAQQPRPPPKAKNGQVGRQQFTREELIASAQRMGIQVSR